MKIWTSASSASRFKSSSFGRSGEVILANWYRNEDKKLPPALAASAREPRKTLSACACVNFSEEEEEKKR